MISIVPMGATIVPTLRDGALLACFWCGYLTGLVRGVAPILLHKIV
jgi:hypothetical protein